MSTIPIINENAHRNDPEVRRALEWFISLMGPSEWKRRRDGVARRYSRIFQPRAIDPGDFPIPMRDTEDVIGWYLYLCEASLDHPRDYEFAQGSRVVPFFKAIGRDLESLRQVIGHEDRARKLLTSDRKNPDPGIFELLVGTAYARDGWNRVEFVPEAPPHKRHELDVSNGSQKIAVECKRLAKSSKYSLEERDHFQRLWQPLAHYLMERRIGVDFEFTFHQELRLLPDDFLLRIARDRVRLIEYPTVIHDDADVRIVAARSDLSALHENSRRNEVKAASGQFMKLATGSYERHQGFAWSGEIKPVRENPSYIDEVKFLVCAKWDCDSPAAIERKARDILDLLSKAVQQLPTTGPCVVHFGIEALDGDKVEAARFDRIRRILADFRPAGRRLDWIYVNLFVPESPPDRDWVIDETVYKFDLYRHDRIPEPLKNCFLVLPGSVESHEKAHWQQFPGD